jgi:hypothetical protein
MTLPTRICAIIRHKHVPGLALTAKNFYAIIVITERFQTLSRHYNIDYFSFLSRVDAHAGFAARATPGFSGAPASWPRLHSRVNGPQCLRRR